MIIESEIAKRIKAARINKDLTLQDMAELTGFTKGYLSKVEKSKKAPPVSTIGKIAKVLNLPISHLLGVEDNVTDISLVRKSERTLMAGRGTKFGYCYEALSHPFRGKHMEPFVLTYPDTKNPKRDIWFEHDGEEILFVLQGRMLFLHGDKEFILEEGDCVYFDASIPHYGETYDNEKELKCLIVIYGT